ncbi:hypothetical protein GCM10027190_51100 [Spirosoma areae]
MKRLFRRVGDCRKLGFQSSQIVLKDVPQYLIVDAEVAMNKPVAKTNDVLLGYVRMRFLKVNRQLIGGFADDFKITFNDVEKFQSTLFSKSLKL